MAREIVQVLPADSLITDAELAHMFLVTTRNLHRALQKAGLAWIQIGGTKLIDVSDIRRLPRTGLLAPKRLPKKTPRKPPTPKKPPPKPPKRK